MLELEREATRYFAFGSDPNVLAFLGRRNFIAGARAAIAERGEVRQLTPEGTNAVGLAWMPSGDAIAVIERTEKIGRGGDSPVQVAVYGVKGGRPQRVVALTELVWDISGMAVHPDGRTAVAGLRLAGMDRDDLAEIDLFSGTVRLLEQTPRAEGGPVFVDRTTVAYVVDTTTHFSQPYNDAVAVRDVASGTTRTLTPPGWRFGSVQLAPDGRTLVADGWPLDGKDGDRALWAIPLEGGEPQLVHDDGGPFALEPGGAHVVVVEAASSRLRRLPLALPD